jgi:hypothetical protein
MRKCYRAGNCADATEWNFCRVRVRRGFARIGMQQADCAKRRCRNRVRN